MPTTFTVGYSFTNKPDGANHRKWGGAVIGNGESWPRFIPPTTTVVADVVRLGIIPTYSLAVPTTAISGASSAATYGVQIVYRSTSYFDGLSLDNIQSNGSNIVDITVTAADAIVLAKVTTPDAKVDSLDIYVAQKTSGIYGTFYRVVKSCTNGAGNVTFNPLASNGILIGGATSSGTLDTTGTILATDNDFPTAQPIVNNINGRAVFMGGINKRVTGTFINGNGTVTTTETVYDGIEFWNIRRDSDTTGGFDGRGTYLCRYGTANTVTLVNVDGSADTYDGANGSGTCSIWQQPNRGYSKLYNPHAVPSDNINSDYPTAILAGRPMPDTNRLLIMGRDWVVAEDYDRLPLDSGLNYVSKTYGCSSHFSVIGAHGRLFWLDLGNNRRNIIMSDGTSAIPISTQKIKSVLNRITLDANGDVWRVGFVHGIYDQNEDTLKWWIYLDNNTVSDFCLELDLSTFDLKDPSFYSHLYQDIFSSGYIRGRTFLGQYGWTGGIARLGQDNVVNRFRDWVEGGTLSGSLAAAGNTVSTFTPAAGTLYTTGSGLAGIQALVWQDTDATTGDPIVNPTFYWCRISSNNATTFTVNYVATFNSAWRCTDVGIDVGTAPSGAGWKWAIGVIPAVIGPKWLSAPDLHTPITIKNFSITHRGQALATAPLRLQTLEDFDTFARSAIMMDADQAGQQVSDITKFASCSIVPPANPVTVFGFIIMDLNVSTDTAAFDCEAITIEDDT